MSAVPITGLLLMHLQPFQQADSTKSACLLPCSP